MCVCVFFCFRIVSSICPSELERQLGGAWSEPSHSPWLRCASRHSQAARLGWRRPRRSARRPNRSRARVGRASFSSCLLEMEPARLRPDRSRARKQWPRNWRGRPIARRSRHTSRSPARAYHCTPTQWASLLLLSLFRNHFNSLGPRSSFEWMWNWLKEINWNLLVGQF